MNLIKSVLIALEGIDGCGKTTLGNTLYHYFQSRIPTILTKEPGGSQLGKHIRTILQEKSFPVSAKAEYLLFAADRAQHMKEVIEPALTQKTIIISDRMADSSLAYQGYGRGLDLEMIRSINQWAMNGNTPDVVLYVRIDAQTAFERIIKRNEALTAFEQEKIDFFERVINGFETIFSKRQNVIILDGKQSPDALARDATEKLIIFMKENGFISL